MQTVGPERHNNRKSKGPTEKPLQPRDLGPERLAVLEVGRGAVPNIQAVGGQELVVSGE